MPAAGADAGPPPSTTLAALAATHDVFLVDQFGTLHDGVRLYPQALAALRALRRAGRRVVLLSNSGKRAAANARRLERLGIPPDAYDRFVTSGEAAWQMLHDRRLPAAAGARRCLLLSRDGDRSAIDGLDLEPVADAADAELVIIAGSEGERLPLAHYRALLEQAAARRLPALCLNPDRTMLTALGPAFGAGRIAELYEALGGTVTWIGKPHREIYDTVLTALGEPERARVIGVGDSVEHDIAGARAAGCHAALVRAGIIAGADDEAIAAECRRYGAWPDAMLDAFA